MAEPGIYKTPHDGKFVPHDKSQPELEFGHHEPDRGVRRKDPDDDSAVDDSAAGDEGIDDADQEGHIGATEDQVSNTPAPAGNAFKDEPKQG